MNRRTLILLPCFAFLLGVVGNDADAQEELVAAPAQAASQLSAVQWVQPKTAGVFKADVFVPVVGGASAAVDDAVLELRGADGWSGKGETNRLGRVTITGVEPGVYSVSVTAPGLFAVYAMQIVGESVKDQNTYPERARISCAFIDKRAARRMLTGAATPKPSAVESRDGKIAVLEEEGVAVTQGSADGLMTPFMEIVEGQLIGHLYHSGSGFRAAGGLRVSLMRDGEVVSSAVSGANGKVVLSNVEPGVHTLIAGDGSSFVVMGIETAVLAADANTSLPMPNQHFVSMLQEGTDSFSIQTTEFDFDASTTDETTDPTSPSPTSGGGS